MRLNLRKAPPGPQLGAGRLGIFETPYATANCINERE